MLPLGDSPQVIDIEDTPLVVSVLLPPLVSEVHGGAGGLVLCLDFRIYFYIDYEKRY